MLVTLKANKVSAVYKRAVLRVCSTYKNIAGDAVFFISGIMPIDDGR